MEFLSNEVVVALVIVTVLYALLRIFMHVRKNNDGYEEKLEMILTSDNHKVKGKFED